MILSAKIKELKLSKLYKKTASLFLYFEEQMHLYPCVYLYFYATVILTIFNIILCTICYKIKVILNLNLSHTIYS